MNQRGVKQSPGRTGETERKGPPTIHDVARMAGVSTSTVSRSLTGGPRVSAATRARVRRIAEDLSYRPSRSAQSLRSSRTGTIGLLAPTMENPVAYDHLRVVVRAAFEAGYTVLVADGQDSAEIQEAELARIRDFRVDGLIVGRGVLQVTPALLEFVRSGVPVEPALSEEVLNSNMHGVVVPFSEFVEGSVGAIVGFRRLIELGHTRFALFHLAERPARLTESRYKLLARMLAEAELPMPERIPVQIGRFADCTAEVQRLAASNLPPTAIISANGRLTPYILEGMQSAGLRIPADVSLLCFGDSQWHRAYSPPLAVVREDYEEVARATLARLVARIEGREYREVTARPSEFVMRGSIGAPPLDRRGTAGRSAANELSEETATP